MAEEEQKKAKSVTPDLEASALPGEDQEKQLNNAASAVNIARKLSSSFTHASSFLRRFANYHAPPQSLTMFHFVIATAMTSDA